MFRHLSLTLQALLHKPAATGLFGIVKGVIHSSIFVFHFSLLSLLLTACSADRFIPTDEATILSSVSLESDSRIISPSSYRGYVRQEPNARWFNLAKVPLGIYCLQSSDSTSRFNRFLRRMGEAPVIYNDQLTATSVLTLSAALQNNGFLHSVVRADTINKKRRTHVTYRLSPGLPNYVDSIAYQFDNDTIRDIYFSTQTDSRLRKGMLLEASALSAERNRFVNILRDRGYYNVNREFVSFRADTLKNDYGVDLTLRVICPAGIDPADAYRVYRLGNVTVHEAVSDTAAADTTHYRNITIRHQPNHKLRLYRRVYGGHIALQPDSLYRATDLQRTYASLGGLSAVSYSTVAFRPDTLRPDRLDASVFVNLARPHTLSAELEGTNTAGDLGAAVTFGYANRNLLRGGETFSLKLRGAYEAITGLDGYDNQNYTEYGVETSLRFPTLLAPFVPRHVRQAISANSELSLLWNTQDRPEFHRRTLTAAWTYRWSPISAPRLQHRLDLLSLNYVYMPWVSSTFRHDYLENNESRYALLRYTYENLLIMKWGYTFTYSSLPTTATTTTLHYNSGYQLRFAVETAGNLLHAFSRVFHGSRDENGNYTVGGIAYSQYAKFDIDYARSIAVGEFNAVALHAFLGLAIPYGNSNIVPYEKRYFAGGANSVRGWSVRELGPGSYTGSDGKVDFINQTGNLKLDLSVEYRTRLFWKIHGAAFVDAGNVWSTRSYDEQPGGEFRWNKFYRQIAVAYGLGLRLNLDYFVLRFDGGMKAINPAYESGRNHYPIIHPRFSRDFTFHFAVGMPF